MNLHLVCGKDLQQFKQVPHAPPVQTRVYGEQMPPAQERGGTPRDNLWFYLPDRGEDMRRWDGKPTSALAAQVCELREKINHHRKLFKEKWHSSFQWASPQAELKG